MYSRWDFKPLLHDGYVDILQPDVSHAGASAKLCASRRWLKPTTWLSRRTARQPIALAACLQVDAVARNAFIQEQSLGIHYNRGNDLLDYLTDAGVFAYDGGFVRLPSAPGLGISINEEVVREAAKKGHQWRNPLWRLEDGSVAEW
ncbi:MAG: enolase C-terminal domain-like protein [Anaerolineae bacterium]